jgi:hypothetical protein
MATYSTEDFERIATAIDVDVSDITRHETLFEAAAFWYRMDCGSSKRTPPSKMCERMNRIAKSARRLLTQLQVGSYDEAADGPGNFEVLEILASADEPGEDAVVNATRRIGRLDEIFDAIEAASELELRARKAADDVVRLGKLTVAKGHHGEAAVNNWIASMMEIYRKITGSEPATSVGGPGQPNEGIASGPFIRFLKAAGKAVEIKYAEDAWRSRVRTILKPHNK